MEEILKQYSLLNNQNVPRETFLDFEAFISMLRLINKEINIISKKTSTNEIIRERHIIDSAGSIFLKFLPLSYKLNRLSFYM